MANLSRLNFGWRTACTLKIWGSSVLAKMALVWRICGVLAKELGICGAVVSCTNNTYLPAIAEMDFFNRQSRDPDA
jgi:hypothetical protein